MQIAALIFLASGLAYLGWDLSLTLTQGAGVGSLLMAAVASALLYQACELFRNKPGARLRAIISSGAIVVASGYIASSFVFLQFPQSLFKLPAEAWPVFGGAVIVSVAHTTVVVLLALRKPRPNPVVERTP